MRKINQYFFGEEEICKSDAVFFYGMYTFAGIIGVTVLLPALLLY